MQIGDRVKINENYSDDTEEIPGLTGEVTWIGINLISVRFDNPPGWVERRFGGELEFIREELDHVA